MSGHKMIQGDCLAVLPTLPDASVDAVVTSPPYLRQRDYNGGMKDWDVLMDSLLHLRCAADDCQLLVNLGLVHRNGECLPYWEPWRERMRAAGWRFFGWYVWDKGCGIPGNWGGRLSLSHEFVLHFNKVARQSNKWVPCRRAGQISKGYGTRRANGKLRSPYHERPVQLTKISDSVIRVNRKANRGIRHPAVFPVEFATHLIRSFCPEGGTVLDPFMGSGTTGVACLQTGRRFIGIELDPSYFAIAQARLAKAEAAERQGVAA